MTKGNSSISVLLVSYNHEKHIHQALDSLFKQDFNGPIELVVADDMSTDRTLSIIKKYEGSDDRFTFKYLDYSKNLGITQNYKRGFAACTQEYVAVLEGDDYWTHPQKLTRQREFLSTHWEADLCSNNYFIYEEDSAHFTPRVPISTGHRLISARELIADNIVGNFSTCMYRRIALARLPEAMFNIKSYDWITNIILARSSLIGFIEEPMSVYRLHSTGVWTQQLPIEKLKNQLGLIPSYDKLTDHVFHDDFELLANRLRHVISSSKIERAAKRAAKPFLQKLPVLLDFLPPFFVITLKLLIPAAMKNIAVKILNRSRSA